MISYADKNTVASRIAQKLERYTKEAIARCDFSMPKSEAQHRREVSNYIDGRMRSIANTHTLVAGLAMSHKKKIKQIHYESRCLGAEMEGQICIVYDEIPDKLKYGGPGFPGRYDGELCPDPVFCDKIYRWDAFLRRWESVPKDTVENADELLNSVTPSHLPKIGKGGSFSSFSVTGIIGGGITYEIGFVTDANENKALFFTFHGHLGIGGGFALNSGSIEPTGERDFVITDWAGEGGGYDCSINTPFGSWGVGRGGNFDSKTNNSFFKEGYNSFPNYNLANNKTGYIVNQASHGNTPSAKIGVGIAISRSKTWIVKLK